MPAPKPLAQHRRDGTIRRDRHGDRAEEAFERGRPKPTARVPQDARWLWKLVVAKVPEGQLSPLDSMNLEALCRWWSRWNYFDGRLKNEVGQNDEYKTAMLAVAAWKQVEKIAMRYGLSSLDRTRLKAPAVEDKQEDPLEALKLIGAKRA